MVKIRKWLPIGIVAAIVVQDLPERGTEPAANNHVSVEALPADDSAELRPARWSDDRLTVANLGHSTLLINFFGVRIITDPALFARVGLRVGPFFTICPRRLSPVALPPQQLHELDVILVTHAHMDHLDLNSLRVLPKTAVVVACSECGRLITPLGYLDVRELDWGEYTSIKGLKVTAMARIIGAGDGRGDASTDTTVTCWRRTAIECYWLATVQ